MIIFLGAVMLYTFFGTLVGAHGMATDKAGPLFGAAMFGISLALFVSAFLFLTRL